MNARILTLFGEELVPEQLQAVPKPAPADQPENGGQPVPVSELLAGWRPAKQYYAIGEVAQLFGIRTSNVRFWTNEFGLEVRTTRKGDRLYTPANIAELRAIYHLMKERGFTIAGAKAKLRESGRAAARNIDLRQSLLQLRNQLLLIRNKLV